MWQGPEMLFSPHKLTSIWDKPLDQVVDNCIQSCPIDVRRPLYSNIMLSGGTTMFNRFKTRLRVGIKNRVDERLSRYAEASGFTPTAIDVNVEALPTQRFAVWFGASKLASMPDFYNAMHTRADYLEKGASIARSNVMFRY